MEKIFLELSTYEILCYFILCYVIIIYANLPKIMPNLKLYSFHFFMLSGRPAAVKAKYQFFLVNFVRDFVQIFYACEVEFLTFFV